MFSIYHNYNSVRNNKFIVIFLIISFAFTLYSKDNDLFSKLAKEDIDAAADQLEFIGGNIVGTGNVVVKYKDILPKEYQSRLKVNRGEMIDCLERASLLAKEGKNNLVKLSIVRDKILISSRSEEGNVKEELFVEKEGNDLEIGFNAKYLLDALKVIDDEEVVMEFNTNVSPCLIKPLEGNRWYEYLILPVRISPKAF